MKEFQNITNKQIEQYGVQSLADRPNSTGGYGDKGLSALELKLAFDKFATFLAGKINEIHKVLAGDEAGEYIAVLLRDSGIENLAELVAAIESGKMAQILQLYPAASEAKRASLQNIVYDFAKTLSEHGKTISEVLKYPTYTESDPTVPKWAKAANKPSYTANEVGARPDTWMPTASDVGARPNTWTPTASDVGAAPAGYGLGENNTILVSDANDAVKIGFYRFDPTNGTNFPTVYGNMRYGSFIVTRVYSTVQQIAVYENVIAVRYGYIDSGEWSDWEYLNPPMAVGVEYRTTERYMGKPVYVTLFHFGALPNASHKYIYTGDHVDRIVETKGNIIKDDRSAVLPIKNITAIGAGGDINTIVIAASDRMQITVETDYDASAWAAYFILKYTKTTG